MENEIESETALEWFSDRLKDPSLCIRTGCEELDNLLGGIVPLASVTEIAGDVGTRKFMVSGLRSDYLTISSVI